MQRFLRQETSGTSSDNKVTQTASVNIPTKLRSEAQSRGSLDCIQSRWRSVFGNICFWARVKRIFIRPHFALKTKILFDTLTILHGRVGKCGGVIKRRIKKEMQQSMVSLAFRPSLKQHGCLVEKKHESKMNAVQMRSLRKICVVKLCEWVRNTVIIEMRGFKEHVVT